MTEFGRGEVEAAYRNFVQVGDSGNWSAWADLHSEDGRWVEHHLGTFVGREAIRKAILDVMAPVPMMRFPVEWHVIEGNRVVYYPWQVMPTQRVAIPTIDSAVSPFWNTRVTGSSPTRRISTIPARRRRS